MANVFDYLDWRGDLSFRHSPFNDVDNIIFSIIAYYPFDGIVGGGFGRACVPLPEAAKKLYQAAKDDEALQRLFTFGRRHLDFLLRLAGVPRYSGCRLCGYVNKVDVESEMQFAAITVMIPDTPAYVSFRGTDTAIIGWKEDFNMILNDTIPAQIEAAAYLNTAAKHIRGKINSGGHSKGGNLAVYAAAFCGRSVQRRIKNVYSNDAPGFNKKIVSSDQYKNIEKKICCYIPESSVVGLLFEYTKDYKVVKSSETGIMQHDPFSWEITGKDMVYIEAVSKGSIFVNKTLMQWLESMDRKTRAVFVETLFTVLDKANIKSVHDFTGNALKNTVMLVKSLVNVDNESKNMLFKTFLVLFKIAKQNAPQFIDVKMPFQKSDIQPVGNDTI